MYIALVVSLLLCLHAVSAHKVSFGSCTKPEGKQGFDFKQFAGTWYVLHKVKTSVLCLMDAFYNDDGQLMYREKSLIPDISSALNLEADLEEKSGDGQYTITYSRFLPDAALTILDTDYNNWAVIYKCQEWPLIHRYSGSILVRSLDFSDTGAINKAFETLEAASVSRDLMSEISHEDCVSPAESNFIFNVDGFKVGIDGKVGGSIVETVRDISDTISSSADKIKNQYELLGGDEDDRGPVIIGNIKEQYEQFDIDAEENSIPDRSPGKPFNRDI